MEFILRTILGALGAMLALSLPSGAATLTGTGNPGSAMASATVETFSGVAAGDYSTLTLGNVTITGVDGTFTVGGDYADTYNNPGPQSVYNGFDYAPSTFRFDFASTVSAFAFLWGASDFNWTLTAYNASGTALDSLVIGPVYGSNAGDYFGIAAAGISYATLVASAGDFVFIDNFASTTVPTVPVPAALPLLLGALGGLAMLRRRRG
jgi:hypothetical protein